LGAAGTGKSTELRERAKDNPMYARLTATTGVAAINLGPGVTTINSVLKYFDTASLREAYDDGDLTTRFVKIARAGYEWLLIDEVSMLCAEQLDLICQSAEEAQKRILDGHLDGNVPGIMLSGDFVQLPPVDGDFAFKSRFWQRFEENTTRLTKIYRQDNPIFLQALQFARAGQGMQCAHSLKKAGVVLVSDVDQGFKGVTLFPVNAQVEKMNRDRFNMLPGVVEEFASTRWGIQAGEWRQQIPESLYLKLGTRVMILVNEPVNFSYVNGDQATVVGFGAQGVELETDRGYKFELGYIRRKVLSNTPPVNAIAPPEIVVAGVELKRWKDCGTPREKAIYMEEMEAYGWDCFFKERPYMDARTNKWAVGEVGYVPLRLGYALTFNKAQGLTLDSVQIDSRMKWAGNPASMYVAISRCRTPENVRIVTKGAGDLARRFVTHKEVMRWV
jgi:hypothetical protein